MTDEEVAALSIGVVNGDSDSRNRAWGDSAMAIARRVIEVRAGKESPLRLNVIYHIDGRLAPNEFEGVRTGRFSKKLMLLAVQVAVQDTEAEEPERTATLLAGLAEAVEQAEVWARRKGIADSLPDLRDIASNLCS